MLRQEMITRKFYRRWGPVLRIEFQNLQRQHSADRTIVPCPSRVGNDFCVYSECLELVDEGSVDQ